MVLMILIYMVVFFYFRGLVRLLLCLFFVETLSWIFSLLIRSLSLKYLLVQRYFLLVRVIGALWRPSVIFLAIFLKVGLPPFQLWFIHIRSLLKKWEFYFFVSVHKLFPLFILGKILLGGFWSLSILMAIWVVGFLITQIRRFFNIIVASSLLHSVWLVLGVRFSPSIMIFYWTLYSILIGRIFFTITFTMPWLNLTNQRIVVRLLWLVISGLPPFTLFVLKVSVLRTLILIRGLVRLLVILISVVSLAFYYRAFHLTIPLRKTSKINRWFPLIVLFSIFGWI